MDDTMKWRTVRVHADDDDAFDVQMLLNDIERRLREGSGTSHSFVATATMREASVSLRLVLDEEGRRSTLLVPLYEGWPFPEDLTRTIVRDRLDHQRPKGAPIGHMADVDDVLAAIARIADLCADALPIWDDDQNAAALKERMDACLDVCAMLHASTDPRIEAYRASNGHVDVDRSDDYDGSVTTLILDPEMAGDDRHADDLVDPVVMNAILARDPFDVALTSAGNLTRTWKMGRIGPDEGITCSSSDCDPMDLLRRLRALTIRA
jgi:hypothetical protein